MNEWQKEAETERQSSIRQDEADGNAWYQLDDLRRNLNSLLDNNGECTVTNTTFEERLAIQTVRSLIIRAIARRAVKEMEANNAS